MRIRLLGGVINARGSFRRGQIVDWPEEDARPLVDAGVAEVAPSKSQAKAEPSPSDAGDSPEGEI